MRKEPTVFSRIIKRELPFKHLHELLQDDQNQDLLRNKSLVIAL